MNSWESGRESGMLDAIIAGRKTIEGRLARGKFVQYAPGDIIWLRRDYRGSDGVLRDGESRQVAVRVVDIRKYNTFLSMMAHEDFIQVVPAARTAQEAASEYDLYYSRDEQSEFGVLAIQIEVVRD